MSDVSYLNMELYYNSVKMSNDCTIATELKLIWKALYSALLISDTRILT